MKSTEKQVSKESVAVTRTDSNRITLCIMWIGE